MMLNFEDSALRCGNRAVSGVCMMGASLPEKITLDASREA